MPRHSSRSWRAYRPDTVADRDGNVAYVGATPAAAVAEAAPQRVAERRRQPPANRYRVLGLDPGSRRTGFGVIDCIGSDAVCVAQGCIDVAGAALADRLRLIHAGVTALIDRHAPDEVAIERVFVKRNVDSALKLGQARGAALAAVQDGEVLFEYAPRAVKLAIVGSGAADKIQVAHMVCQILRLAESPVADAADALAIALCHAHHRRVDALVLAAGAGT
jgi:crossover junction endodeoxyribonuclease RuvC